MRKHVSALVLASVFAVILGFIIFVMPRQADDPQQTINTSLNTSISCKNCSIMEYDSSGDLTLDTQAGYVTVSKLSSQSKTGLTPISLLVDGNQWLHYGGTAILLPDSIDVVDDGEPLQKSQVVVLSTAGGVPVLVLQGDRCSMVEIPELGMTAVTVDKQKVYVYDTNVDIIPVVVMKGDL